MDQIVIPSGCVVEKPLERLLAFCREEYYYYDAIPSTDANSIGPMDVLVTVAMNSRLTEASLIRRVHRDLADRCNSRLREIPEGADLLSFDASLRLVERLLHEAVQVSGVLVSVATKVLHRKRRLLIPMLDSVLTRYYLTASGREVLWEAASDKQLAAAVATDVLKLFRDDLRKVHPDVQDLREQLARVAYDLSPVRILEVLIWTQKESQGYYR